MPIRNDNQEDEVMEQLQALGYIDPGAGSSMTQLLLAGFFKTSRRIKLFFRRFFGFSQSNSADEQRK